MGKTISMQMKQQRKYQTVRLSIKLSTFCLAQFKVNENPVWITDLGEIPVWWFPAKWTLKERKQREKFQATIRNILDSMTLAALWKDSCPHSFLSAIKALDNQYTWEQVNLSWNRHVPPKQPTRSQGNNTNKNQRISGSQQTQKKQQNSKKNSKKKPQETKSDKKSKKDKKDKSRKASRSKILAEIIDVLRKLI
ncbi:hypothetical protein RirG_269730 [Rhizophagus irregularis DAOM 197198w]|uniref:Uncharacterized protein n=1 Tax=Rhizophagus irregularis (strain DAOM 197198w) TaxID=1432141 RepID=A0A015I0U1_RHIIW|nr:hypothetical protein RirG_269730 [Rhizophagus irregularis DAOM 197198w]